MTGRVVSHAFGRGWGWINVRGQERDYFFHAQDVEGGVMPLKETFVEFDPVDGPRGPRAINVRICDGA